MTLVVPDVNILIHAFRTDTAGHETYATWLRTTMRDGRLGIADTIATGFVRIVTHPRIFAEPTPTLAALEFIDAIAARPRASWLHQGAEPWQHLGQIARDDSGVRGNLVPDAHIAALCLSNGAHLATRDRGFARFPGLRFFDPAA
ncbi:TA system VapC family ribonuclease toxin [Microbacterium xanthum]|uniref:TA system VapC family ribonuclease toxin n=1 Tax=Microbacterium xanthum TaxID=3079794 RepID=UPI002AD4775F|nr:MULTISPECIES: TA system VapC family ribonuclease toxin [unclassified Microbacterium]MDZ8170720.1 TA system VapC family ribonuclease toxin [Microbacterium sp. KSW-48]MDZ8201246.1 TA system VapC family ribonuclease toxin [Microbacterium sp. SSW1-59]